MDISNEKKRICICYFLFMFCYTFVSLLLFDIYGGFHYKDGVPSSRPYDTEIGMFYFHEYVYDENGQLQTHKEITGYIMEIRMCTCPSQNDTGTRLISYRDYPAAMKLVYVALFWHLLLSLFIYTPITVLPLFSTKRLCNLKERTLDIFTVSAFVFICVFHVLGYIVYVQVIGKEVGFSWNNLTRVVYIGLANACFSPLILVLLIMLYKRHMHSNENGLIYVKYKKIKSVANNQHSKAEEPNTSVQSQSSERIYRPLDTQSIAGDIRNLVEKLWKPAKVGIGRDAKGLYHSSINITDITPIGNDSVFQTYLRKKKCIEYFANSVGGKLTPPQGYCTGTSPIHTAEFGNLVKAIHCNINEYYLFHGTPINNIESIERYGFFMEKYKHSMLGKGIYFTEDPVKADQYTGKGDDADDPLCCMILCRVLLGDSVIQRRDAKQPTMTCSATSAPCKTCLKPKPDCHCRKSTKFDSVIFEGLLFREFVVYETCSCFPEFAILYKRVKSDVYPMVIG